jgi:hypothetical protein
MVNAQDMEIFMYSEDTRDLNYEKYFEKGEVITQAHEYNSLKTGA